MPPKNLFGRDGLTAFARYVAPETLFAFDLDGTLSPIVADRSAVTLDAPVRKALERLVALATVSVVTGRSRKDALSILGFEPQLLVGNHGAEWPGEQNARRNWDFVAKCLKWRELLHDVLFYTQGVEIEFKGESIALHYRGAADPEQALAQIHAAVGTLVPAPRMFGGKYVVNVMPEEALTKGQALVAAMEQLSLSRAVYFGDDVTDEEVFRLEGVDVFGIHIGEDQRTAAAYYLSAQSDLLGLLDSMVAILEGALP